MRGGGIDGIEFSDGSVKMGEKYFEDFMNNFHNTHEDVWSAVRAYIRVMVGIDIRFDCGQEIVYWYDGTLNGLFKGRVDGFTVEENKEDGYDVRIHFDIYDYEKPYGISCNCDWAADISNVFADAEEWKQRKLEEIEKMGLKISDVMIKEGYIGLE